ncbi:hypothetical protein QQS21_009172 [Conoideocrella luteorostrata]|uniref:DH domain-containing protein n=1 Tax=Conoideocrella luteorostrata TaxID=1105319 RepID=A0AAJ0CHE8_9HYPO|nr:hypothetical protein QQS21_009172 [Conoideocrella luteorostrata]
MAVALSNFYPSHISREVPRPPQPTRPLAIVKQNFSFALPQWIGCPKQAFDGSRYKNKQIKPLIAVESIESTNEDHDPRSIPCKDLNQKSHNNIEQDDVSDVAVSDGKCPRSPFHQWIDSLQKRAKQLPTKRTLPGNKIQPWSWSPEDDDMNKISCYPARCKSSSGSFSKFVSAVRSATVSLADSWGHTALSQCQSHVDRDIEFLDAQKVSDDIFSAASPKKLDPEQQDRALKRRRVLEELINTEQSYIGDIRLLLNVYVTMLASLPSSHLGLRRSVNQNLCEILQLHEEILNELCRAVSHSDDLDFNYYRSSIPASDISARDKEEKLCSVHCQDHFQTEHVPNSPRYFAEPQIVTEVSRVFEKKMGRFFIYKEYGAKYEMITQDTALIPEALPGWECNQKGLEALSVLLSSSNWRDHDTRRASTLKDLLVKPIQRICKYPLLFGELLKFTPVSDCPNAHMAAESVLARFREANAEINKATCDPHMRSILSRTWLLQDRLVFPNRNFDSVSKDRVRSFGHLRLCGTLHVCWQKEDKVDGQYLICLLYRDILCLACAGKVDPIYTIKACINVHKLKVEDADNGRGLQCHTAPFSWKVVFELNNQLFEMIMTACGPKEEMEWRARLTSPVMRLGFRETASYTFMDLGLKSLGTVAGKSGPVIRQLSIRRATTISPKPALYQVILRNTSGLGNTNGTTSAPLSINRSHSLLAARARITYLSPSRTERARLEALLADVWSREILPFPGIATRSRSERLVRTSASTVIRKLSVSSITNSFVRRAGGLRKRLSLDENCRPSISQTTFEKGPEYVPEGQLVNGINNVWSQGSFMSAAGSP